MDRICLEEERSHHTEIPATPAHRPEEIGVFNTVCSDTGPVRQHDFHLKQIIDRESIMPREITSTASECQPVNAGGRNNTARHGQTEFMCRFIDISPNTSTPDSNCMLGSIHLHSAHLG